MRRETIIWMPLISSWTWKTSESQILREKSPERVLKTIWVLKQQIGGFGNPQNGWFITWKSLWTNGWFGGVFTPHYFLVQHPFEFDGQKDAELSLHRDPRQKNGEWTWELEITGYEGKRWQAELPVLAGLHPQKLTWNLEMVVSNRNLLFQGSIFRFHVCFGWITSINLVKWATRPIYPQLR